MCVLKTDIERQRLHVRARTQNFSSLSYVFSCFDL